MTTGFIPIITYSSRRRSGIYVPSYPNTQVGSKIFAASVLPSRQGGALSLSYNETVLAVGAGVENTNTGAVYLWNKVGTTFTQEARLVGATSATGNAQGADFVQMDDTGTVVYFSSIGDSANKGAFYEFVKSSPGVWTQVNKIVGVNTAGKFGSSLKFDNTRATFVVGAQADSSTGKAFIYNRDTHTGAFSVGPELVPTGVSGVAGFGTLVLMSQNGLLAVVSAPANQSSFGTVHVFQKIAGTWSQTQMITNPAGTAGTFGVGIDWSRDSKRLVISASLDNGNVGAFYVFENNGSNTYVQVGSKYVPTGGSATPRWGLKVAISPSGDVIAVSGPQDTTVGTGGGAVAVYSLNYATGLFVQRNTLRPSSQTTPSNFGNNIALSTNGDIGMFAGLFDATSQGGFWVFKP